MSDHAILGILLVLSIAIGIGGLLILGLVLGGMLRESQRLTRAVAGGRDGVPGRREDSRVIASRPPP